MDAFHWYLALGVAAGTLAGLLGIGGGLIIVPSLIAIFNSLGISPSVQTHIAIGTSLTTIVVTSFSSIRTHHQANKVDWAIFRRLAMGIVFGVAAGALIVDRLSGEVLQGLIGIFALWVAVKMGFKLSPKPTGQIPGHIGMFSVGGTIGLVSSMSGIGGGALTVPFLTWCRVNIQRAIGTSAACGFPIAVVGAVRFMVTGWGHPDLPDSSLGYVYWPAVLGVVTMSVIFAHVGAKLSHRLPADTLKRLFALLLLVIGIKLIWSALH